MALVEQLGDNSWQVVCAAYCHMSLVFAIIHLFNFFFFFSSFSFSVIFNFVLIN